MRVFTVTYDICRKSWEVNSLIDPKYSTSVEETGRRCFSETLQQAKKMQISRIQNRCIYTSFRHFVLKPAFIQPFHLYFTKSVFSIAENIYQMI
jgi:hypothetical protein